MANRIVITNNNQQFTHYNVGQPVGPHAANHAADVELVQFLMVNFWLFNQPGIGDFPAPGDLDVDGKPGPTTFRWIKRTQEVMLTALKAKIHVDGRVDVANNVDLSTISKTNYTIILLSRSMKRFRPDDFDNLEFAPDCPRRLAAELASSALDIGDL